MKNDASLFSTIKLHKMVPVGIIFVGIILFIHFRWHHYLTFESLKENHAYLEATVKSHFFWSGVIAVFFLITVTAFSLPVTTMVCLAIGYLFPFPISTFMVIFSLACGGTLLFLSVKMGITDHFFSYYEKYIYKFETRMEKYGQLYLIMIRFIPIIPFWMVNIICGLIDVSTKRFIWTTVIGIIPGSAIYTYAGNSLQLLFDSHDKLSLTTFYIPQILIGFTTLIAFVILTIMLDGGKNSNPFDRKK